MTIFYTAEWLRGRRLLAKEYVRICLYTPVLGNKFQFSASPYAWSSGPLARVFSNIRPTVSVTFSRFACSYGNPWRCSVYVMLGRLPPRCLPGLWAFALVRVENWVGVIELIWFQVQFSIVVLRSGLLEVFTTIRPDGTINLHAMYVSFQALKIGSPSLLIVSNSRVSSQADHIQKCA